MAYTPPTPYAGLSGQVAYSSGLQLVDIVLSNLAKQFRPDGFLYDQIVTSIPVDKGYGRYPVFDPSTFFTTGGALEVADDAQTPIIDFNWSHDVYTCLDRRLATRITRREALQAHEALRLDYSKTIGLLTVFANNRENRLATRMRATANGGQFTNAEVSAEHQVGRWHVRVARDDSAGHSERRSLGDARFWEASEYDYHGLRGCSCDRERLHREAAAAISHRPGDASPISLPTSSLETATAAASFPSKLFGFNVLVADGTLQNTARPGQAMSLTGTWGQSARLVYVDPTQQWGMPATAYCFRGPVNEAAHQPPSSIMPSGDGGMEPGPAGQWAVVDRWWDYDPPAETIRAWEYVDERIVAPELGVEIGPLHHPGTYEY